MGLFFSKRKGSEQRISAVPPQERHVLSTQLMAGIWSRRDEEGKPRVTWCLDRVNPHDPQAPFRSLTISSLLEMPSAIRQLAECFGLLDFLPADLRRRLNNLALVMAQVDELVRDRDQSNGGENDGADDAFATGRVLSRSVS